MQGDRHLDWRGSFNARDLGGLPVLGGGLTRRGAIVRADALTKLEAQGWEEVEAFGIRTVIDLCNESEIGPDVAPRPAAIATVNIPPDVTEDREFWDVWENGPQFATPLYYRPHLERFPERSAAVIRAVVTGRGKPRCWSSPSAASTPRRSVPTTRSPTSACRRSTPPKAAPTSPPRSPPSSATREPPPPS